MLRFQVIRVQNLYRFLGPFRILIIIIAKI